MSLAHATGKKAWTAIAVIWLLVCGGLGWATDAAIQLERFEARAEQAREDEAAIKLALARIERSVAVVLERENSRPYEHFRPYYNLAHPLHAGDLTELRQPIKLASPLRTLPETPSWLLLHFQASELQGWSSPQLEAGDAAAPAAGVFPAADRERMSTAENWLASLKENYSPSALQHLLEESLSFYAAINRYGDLAQAPPAESDASPQRDKNQFVRRGERLLEMTRQLGETCEPETVALDNLQAGESLRGVDPADDCVPLLRTPMIPVWLDITRDGRLQLALVRSMSVQTSQFCTLQGVLLDWERMHTQLENMIAGRLPGARLVPLRPGNTLTPTVLGTMMQNIPAWLEIPPHAAPAFTLSTGLRNGLVIAWLATLIALLGITYGTLKFVSLTERRMQFVAAVTHELRTPLTSFQLYSDLLRDMPDENAELRRQYAEALQQESRRLARLVENVLAYARVQDRRAALNVNDLSPARVLELAVAGGKPIADKHNKSLVLENRCPPDLRLRTDGEFVLQILLNLIENACKYSAGAGDRRVWITAAADGDRNVRFEVEDAGEGVRPRDRKLIFRPFRRSDAAADTTGGIGLGLALSRHWAQTLGGSLTLQRSSRNGAALSCFALRIPTQP